MTKTYFVRGLAFVSGLFVMALGIALSIKANLGTTPISSWPYVLSLGVVTILMHVFFIAIQMGLLRKDYRAVQLLQLPVALVFGVFTDITIHLVRAHEYADHYFSQWGLCMAGIVLVALGVFLEVRAKVVYLAGEGVCLAIARVFRVEFGKIKVAFDCSLVLLALLSSWAICGRIAGIREGTVISAVLVGSLARFFAQRVKFMDAWMPQEPGPAADTVASRGQEGVPGVVVIVRDFGSGGHEIGGVVARGLSVPFYDSKMIEMSAAQSGLSEEYIQEHEQKLAHRLLFELYEQNYAYVNDEKPPLDLLFMVQSRVVREICAKGPCVIVGRCADFVLKRQAGCFSVFIHAGKAFRTRRITEEYGVAAADAPKVLEATDRERAAYYRYYTHKEWGRTENYDLTIDSSRFGVEGSAELIIRALRAQAGAVP